MERKNKVEQPSKKEPFNAKVYWRLIHPDWPIDEIWIDGYWCRMIEERYRSGEWKTIREFVIYLNKLK